MQKIEMQSSLGLADVQSAVEASLIVERYNLDTLMKQAAQIRDQGHGTNVSYSRKVFIPLTQLCRDVCHYCTFASPPKRGESAYLSPDKILDIAKKGAESGCHEALFTLGDKPELRYRLAREELTALGHDTTLSYLEEMARLVIDETGLLPHLNPGVMTACEIANLRKVSVSQGIMLESVSERLCHKGQAHHGSPDKVPNIRLEAIRLAGEMSVPFTSCILIGIGETRVERIEGLLALRTLHERYGHIQEIIVQNFRAKAGTRMANAPEPSLEDLLWTISVARLIFGSEMNIQAPPNLSSGYLPQLVAAGINDWGGVSPVTPDHVNPEAPWPNLDDLDAETAVCGKTLTPRLAIYPRYVDELDRWVDPLLRRPVLRHADSEGFARDHRWSPGIELDIPPIGGGRRRGIESPVLRSICSKARAGETLSETEIVRLFAARGADYQYVCQSANILRQEVCGDQVTYVVNRNINYTNVCFFGCRFCAFSKGKLSEQLRGRPYDLELGEIGRRAREAWERGATEVCMQGGIHPDYTGHTYLKICETVKEAAPDIHVHAFSPLEVWQGASTLGISVTQFLAKLRDAGLKSLPGTAAEILDDEVRNIICPDKINSEQWLEVMAAAHSVSLLSTATIMFGHVDSSNHWARHLLRIRALQSETGGFTEFVPLPFVHMEAPLYLKGEARRGPTFRESVLMHAVARLVLHPVIANIQTSWVKMGPKGAKECLRAGANDLGGTLMNETITRAAGALHGQELAPHQMESLIRAIGREPKQRSTLYGPVSNDRVNSSFAASDLSPIVNHPAVRRSRRRKADLPRNEDLRSRVVGDGL